MAGTRGPLPAGEIEAGVLDFEGRWTDAFSDPRAIARSPRVRSLLERAIAHHHRSARILRAADRRAAAARAQMFASRARLILDAPQLTQRMHTLSQAVHESTHYGVLLERALEGAMALTGGDLGNVQICDPARGTLRIAAESGFGAEFLEYFAEVDDESSACGRAAVQRAQTVIADVNEDARFAEHREIAASTGFRAVQSTPLVDPGGRLRGVMSTHFRTVHLLPERDARVMEWYAEKVAAAIAAQHGATRLHDSAAALIEQSAHRHDAVATRLSGRGQAPTGRTCEPGVGDREIADRLHHRAREERERAQALARRSWMLRTTLAPLGARS